MVHKNKWVQLSLFIAKNEFLLLKPEVYIVYVICINYKMT